ncbi:hypothetical protein OBBRIDRAFT_110085 [Obba rivulosa]|uniref:Uncharacterized protein n=1 Tax=Obba rivulosa TaxID=1052685 RepID=A0A8E2DJQ3_9APHY|nr:hypothetical protein OBBRIDRAFT_110085 [Obba rivulosa]
MRPRIADCAYEPRHPDAHRGASTWPRPSHPQSEVHFTHSANPHRPLNLINSSQSPPKQRRHGRASFAHYPRHAAVLRSPFKSSAKAHPSASSSLDSRVRTHSLPGVCWSIGCRRRAGDGGGCQIGATRYIAATISTWTSRIPKLISLPYTPHPPYAKLISSETSEPPTYE